MELAVSSFLLGLLATASPCVLPLYPGFLAYLSSQTQSHAARGQYVLGVFVLAGVLSMMLALGALIALLAVPISRTLAVLIPLADVLILCLGILLVLNRNPFQRIPQFAMPLRERPFLNAYLYGLMYGPITLPCSGPLVVSIFVLSLTLEEALSKLWLFIWFGLGFGVPLLVLTFLSGALQQQLTRLFARHSRLINFVGGILLIGIALYDVFQNWEMLRLMYS